MYKHHFVEQLLQNPPLCSSTLELSAFLTLLMNCTDVPALAAYLQLGRMDWKYKTEPQPGQSNFNYFSQSYNNIILLRVCLPI